MNVVYRFMMCRRCGHEWSPPPPPSELSAFIAKHKLECRGAE